MNWNRISHTEHGGAGRRWACVAIVGALAVALSACGGGDGSESSLPTPPAGKATVGGQLSVDGEGVAATEVELQVDSKARAKAKTDADGQFVFEAVDPGSYELYADPVVREGATSEIQGVKLLCTAPGFNQPGEGTFLLGPATITSNGGTHYQTDWSFVSESFTLQEGDALVKDVPVTCEEKG